MPTIPMSLLARRKGPSLAGLALALLTACSPEAATPDATQGEGSTGAEAPPETSAPVLAPEREPLDHEDLEAVRLYRAHLDELARYDYSLAERLAEVPTDSDSLRADPFVALDFVVRHALPFVLEYVYPPYDQEIPDSLRLPRELVSVPPIRDAASFAPARAAILRLASLADIESARRASALEAFDRAAETAPFDEDEELQRAGRSVEVEASRVMAGFLRDVLAQVVQPEEPTRVATVLEAMRALIEVASANDFEGADTTRRAAFEAVLVLRLLYGASMEDLNAPELRVARVLARDAR